jgi:hypothetical protein
VPGTAFFESPGRIPSIKEEKATSRTPTWNRPEILLVYTDILQINMEYIIAKFAQ